MNSFRKKFLSAFVEINDSHKVEPLPLHPANAATFILPGIQHSSADSRFIEHFSQLFAEAGLPGPGYLEFSKMIDVMQAVMTDEKALYSTAFAGLHVQGLDKQKLLASVQQYVNILDEDNGSFESCMRASFQEKVVAKKEEMETTGQAIQKLSQQIATMQQQITTWTEEVAVDEAKISNSNHSYQQALQSCKARLLSDTHKINQYLK